MGEELGRDLRKEPQALGRRAGAAKGAYEVGDASFGPALTAQGVKGDLMPVVDQADGSTG